MTVGCRTLAILAATLLLEPRVFGQTAPDDPANAATAARGLELFRNGEMLYGEASYSAAIEAWTEGYRLTHEPDFLWNIAAAQERMGDIVAALATLDRYRAFARSDEWEKIERRIANLKLRLTEPPPAVERAVETESLPPGKVVAEPMVARPVRASRPVRHGIGWFFVTTGTVGLAIGGVYGVRALDARSEASALCGDLGTDLWCTTDAGPVLEQGERRAHIADVGFAAGTSVLLTGMGLLLPLGGGNGGVAVSARF